MLTYLFEMFHIMQLCIGCDVKFCNFSCGKTTQVPQFILDSYLRKTKDLHMCNIMCTQPRRISAMAVAERVAEERVEKLGKTIGYQIRLEKVQVRISAMAVT